MATNYNDVNHRVLIERFERTESQRERNRKIAYQNSLPQQKTARELEIEALDRWDAMWNRTTRGF
jgi:hypothetical protein